jgi:hypothetical protein
MSDPSRDSSTARSTEARMQRERERELGLSTLFGSETVLVSMQTRHTGFDFFSMSSLYILTFSFTFTYPLLFQIS